jgi:putative FmdB family regulatory protein
VPIFEFACDACGERFELLFRSRTERRRPVCPDCDSRNVRKLFSTFATAGGEPGRGTGGAGGCATCAGGSCATCRG